MMMLVLVPAMLVVVVGAGGGVLLYVMTGDVVVGSLGGVGVVLAFALFALAAANFERIRDRLLRKN